MTPPIPPLERAMKIVIEKLVNAGHNVVWMGDLEEGIEARRIHGKLVSATGWEKREWVAPRFFQSHALTVHLEAAHQDITASGEPWYLFNGIRETQDPILVSEVWKLQHQRSELATSWCEKWNKTVEISGTGRPIDAFLYPLLHNVALKNSRDEIGGGSECFLGDLADSASINLPEFVTPTISFLMWIIFAVESALGLTGAVFPVTKVDPKLDQVPLDFVPKSPNHQKMMDACKCSKYFWRLSAES